MTDLEKSDMHRRLVDAGYSFHKADPNVKPAPRGKTLPQLQREREELGRMADRLKADEIVVEQRVARVRWGDRVVELPQAALFPLLERVDLEPAKPEDVATAVAAYAAALRDPDEPDDAELEPLPPTPLEQLLDARLGPLYRWQWLRALLPPPERLTGTIIRLSVGLQFDGRRWHVRWHEFGAGYFPLASERAACRLIVRATFEAIDRQAEEFRARFMANARGGIAAARISP